MASFATNFVTQIFTEETTLNDGVTSMLSSTEPSTSSWSTMRIDTSTSLMSFSLTTTTEFSATEIGISSTLVTNASVTDINTVNITTRPGFIFDNYPQRVFIAILLLLATVVGAIGNTLVILSVLLAKKLHSVTNVFVVNLATADLLVSLSLPWNVVALLAKDGWPLPDFFCSMAAGVVVVCVGCSVYTLASIAITRLIIVTKTIHWYNNVFTTRVIQLWILFTWLLPFIVAIIPPLAGFGELGYNEKYSSCSAVSTAKRSNEYDILTTVILFPVALLIMIISYIRIFMYVRRHTQKVARYKIEPAGNSAENASGVVNNSFDDENCVESGSTQMEQFSDEQATNSDENTSDAVNNGFVEEKCVKSSSIQNEQLSDEQARNSGNNTPALVNNGSVEADCVSASIQVQHSSTHIEESHVSNLDSNVPPKSKDDFKLSESTMQILGEIDRPAHQTVGLNHSDNTNQTLEGMKWNSLATAKHRTIDRLKNLNFLRPHLSDREITVTKNMFYVVVAFLICFTPFTFCMIIDASDPFLPYATAIIFINSCINPIIYAIKHPNYMETFKMIVRCCWSGIKPPSDILRSLQTNYCCRQNDNGIV